MILENFLLGEKNELESAFCVLLKVLVLKGLLSIVDGWDELMLSSIDSDIDAATDTPSTSAIDTVDLVGSTIEEGV